MVAVARQLVNPKDPVIKAKMQRLNIPLSKHRKTTRQSRRVVWIWALLWLIAFVLVWRGTALWMSRTSIFSAAPNNTVAAIYLQTNSSTIDHIDRLLSSVPLISNRSLDFEDILNLTSGEFAIFFTSTGQRSVAIRANEKDLDTAFFKNLGVTTQSIGDYMLLSENLAPIGGVDTSHMRPFISSVSSIWLGSLWVDGYGHGNIHIAKNEVEIEFQTEKQLKRNMFLETTSIAHVVMNQSKVEIPEMFFDVFPYYSEISEIIVKTDGVLISLNKGALDEHELIKQIQQISAENNPSTFLRTMSDGTTYTELQIEPSMVTVEEISVFGNRVFRTNGLFALLENNQAIISTSESLLESYLQPTKEVLEHCAGASIIVSPEQIFQNIKIDFYDPRLALLSIFNRFSVITLETNKYSNIITLSTDDCG